MKRCLVLLLALSLSLFAFGCGSDEGDGDGNGGGGGGGGGLDAALETINAAATNYVEADCTCYYDTTVDEQGEVYASADACIAAETGSETPTFSECERSVYECYGSELDQYASCVADVYNDAAECLASCPAETMGCNEIFLAADCETTNIDAGLARCGSDGTFTCE